MNEASEWRLPIQDALEKMTRKELDGDVFLRSMMHHPSWLVPGRHGARGLELGVITTPKGRILEVYSDEDALARMERQSGSEFTGELVRLEGHDLFASLAALQVDRLNLNPGQEPKLSWRAEQIDLLVAWGRQAKVELALLEPERVRDPVGTIAAYDGYYLVYERNEDTHSIVLAPDSRGRSLAAVFTSWDSVEAFRASMQSEASGVLETVEFSAKELFPLIQRLDVQGLVFNPWSLIPARALSVALLSEIIPRTEQPHLH